MSITAHPDAGSTGRQPNDDLVGSTHVYALGDDEGGVLTHLPVHSQPASAPAAAPLAGVLTPQPANGSTRESTRVTPARPAAG